MQASENVGSWMVRNENIGPECLVWLMFSRDVCLIANSLWYRSLTLFLKKWFLFVNFYMLTATDVRYECINKGNQSAILCLAIESTVDYILLKFSTFRVHV